MMILYQVAKANQLLYANIISLDLGGEIPPS